MRRIKSHTAEKLTYIKKYMAAYLVATQKIKIRYFIDGFAGTGKCILCDERCDSEGGKCNCGKGKEVDGSALLVLKDKNCFSKYFFIELNKNNSGIMNDFINKEIDESRRSKISINNGDCNKLIPVVMEKFNGWASCLTLLDPEGAELDWNTIKSLSKFKRMDLFILYPYDMALVRLVKDYGSKLDRFYGSKGWKSIFDSATSVEQRRTDLLKFYIDNLKKLGLQFISYKIIRRKNREGKRLYHLILASRNKVATKIMDDIFNKDLTGQLKMKFK